MALAETTLSAACAVDDKQLVVASATGIAPGYEVRVNGEVLKVTKGYVTGATIVPVLRGQSGTLATAHAVTSRVVVGTQADWAQSNPPQTVAPYVIAGRARVVTSYGAAGAIALPPAGADAIAIINGTSALAMTLAVPTKDLDGSILTVCGASTGAHTITVAGGIGGSATIVLATFEASPARCNISFMAMDEVWMPFPSPYAGTVTSLDVVLST
jgi:hypothetical protein